MLAELVAKEVVSEKLATINENETLSKAINFFDERSLHARVVLDDENNYKGMLVKIWLYRSRLDPTNAKVKVLCRRVTKAHEDTSLVGVARYMIGSSVQAVPVFRGGGWWAL